MPKKFVVVPEEDEDEEDDGWTDREFAIVYRLNDDGTKTSVGWIGGEPEDNTYYRSYSWVEDALNDAYNLGVKDGIEKEKEQQFGAFDCCNE